MSKIICPICHRPFTKVVNKQIYCGKDCRQESINRVKHLKKSGQVDNEPNSRGDNIRWFTVEFCPLDNVEDSVPPFTPGFSQFPSEQFEIGLMQGVWPKGMIVKSHMGRYVNVGGGIERVRKTKVYRVPGEGKQGKLLKEIQEDVREFWRECARREEIGGER